MTLLRVIQPELILILAASGIVMWDARFGQYFTVEQKRVAEN